MLINQQSFYLKSGNQYLACTALLPKTVNCAVLMLLPFAEERKGSLPLLLSIARKLYEQETASLIFNWQGTGDSSGEFESVDPADFHIDLNTAFTWLTNTCGDVPITALGVRLSASFILQQELPCISGRVLISPASGDEFMRQLLQRRMVNDMVAYGKAVESRAALLEKLKSGKSVDLDGYIFSSRFYDWAIKSSEVRGQRPEAGGRRSEVRGLNSESVKTKEEHPTSNIPHRTSHNKILLIPGGHSQKTATEIADALDNVETTELRFPPFWNTVGHVDLSGLIDHIAGWISRDESPKPSAAQMELRPPSDCGISSEAWEGQTKRSAVGPYKKYGNDQREWQPTLAPTSSTPCMELINIAAPCNGQNDIATIRSAIDKPVNSPKAGILFLPGWSGDRTGPHRIFVQLARKLTAEGFLCLRPDFRGRGLSDGEHSQASIDSMAEDAGYALAELKSRLPVGTPIYIAAICSGCKVAITLASKHSEIAKMLLLSAESMGSLRSGKTDSNKTKKALKTYLKKLTQPETWKKIITGKVQTKMVTKALVKHETRSDDEARTEDRILRDFENFSSPVHFIFGGSDPDAPGSMEAYKAYCEKNSIPHTQHLVPNAGHSYYSAKWTDEVMKSSTEFLH